jgi:Tfp pilus assembly major pilin PilA
MSKSVEKKLTQTRVATSWIDSKPVKYISFLLNVISLVFAIFVIQATQSTALIVGFYIIVAVLTIITITIILVQRYKYKIQVDNLSNSIERDWYERIIEKMKHMASYQQELNKVTADIENGKISDSGLLINALGNPLSHIEKVMKIILGKEHDIAICIKWIDTASRIKDTNFQSWKVATLVRSASSSNRNFPEDPVSIMGNTDFLSIISERDETFSVVNLKKYAEKNIYKNTTPNWDHKYQSTIVLPIAIDAHHAAKEFVLSNSDRHHILGFLCMDSPSIFTDEDSSAFECATAYMSVFAHTLYILFEQFLLKSREQ